MRTYGTAVLKDGYWHVTAEAHVTMRLKRLFGRIAKGAQGTLRLKATDEVSRDLLWFTQRFPLDVRQPAELMRRSERHVEDCNHFDQLVRGSIEPRVFDLALPPREYQRVAAEMFLRVRGLLLADDLGTGKTVSAICALSDQRTWPALVVTLTHLPRQWQREIERFCPKLKTHVITRGTPYDVRIKSKRVAGAQRDLIAPEFPHVLIINYHKLATWADSLIGVIKTVVFDEVQELRRGESEKTKAAASIAAACDFRLGMSATPIYNFGGEFYNVLSVLRPDALGTREEFVTEWCRGASVDGHEKAEITHTKAFGSYLREAGLMLRRTRKDIARELPGLERVTHHCDADDKALREATNAAAELARIILSKDSSWQERGQATREIDWKLRQATGVAKAPYVATFVRMLVESGERVVLYGWHRQVYSLWLEMLEDLKPALFTGSESVPQKEKAKDAFCKGDARVLVMSLRAGAGLDGLQFVSRTVVFGELDWSPGVHEQCEGRVDRDGQANPVVAYYLVSDKGSDPVVSEVIGLKKNQIEGVRDPDRDVFAKKDESARDGIRRLAERFLKHKEREAQAAE